MSVLSGRGCNMNARWRLPCIATELQCVPNLLHIQHALAFFIQHAHTFAFSLPVWPFKGSVHSIQSLNVPKNGTAVLVEVLQF